MLKNKKNQKPGTKYIFVVGGVMSSVGKGVAAASIGTILQLMGANDSALEYLMKAQSTFIRIGEKEGLATCYNNIGYTHKLKGEYDKAIEYFYKALEIADELNDKRQMARTYNNIGSVHQMGDSNDKAIEVFEKSLQLYSDIRYTAGGEKQFVPLTWGSHTLMKVTLKRRLSIMKMHL